MFEEQITESIEAGAPDITYSGNEGPKSPQQEKQQMMMAQLQEQYSRYVFEMKEQGIQPMTLQQFIEQAMAEGQMSSAQQPMPNRQMAAYGGIMGLDGRKKYGIGSWLKKTARKIIPNEVAKVAEVAAPFVAPFNPIAAGLMSGIGGFDRTGSIGSSLKSGLMNYGLGQGARYLGGAGFQTGINPMTGSGVQGAGFFSKPTGTETGLGKYFNKSKAPVDTTSGNTLGKSAPNYESIDDSYITGKEFNIGNQGNITEKANLSLMENIKEKGLLKGVMQNITEAGLDTKATLGILGLSAAAGAYTAATEVDEVLGDVDRGTGLPSGILGIRTEVIEAFKDPTGEKLAAIRIKYPFLGAKDTKDMSEMAQGGRIGYDEGGPAEIGGDNVSDILARVQELQDEGLDFGAAMAQAMRELSEGKAQGGRIGRAEGGIMDLDGMELDYRAEGGFVPIGEEEKADDVPARLSVNEFVFTADAVRNAGGGDIDQGAEVMERVMKNLEQGGQISEETQGTSGAQEMFNVSERLSEVV